MAAEWMDREQGYVKLWRQTLSSDLMQDPHLLQLFLYCLMRATYIERSVSVKVSQGMTQVELQPGQMIYGRISSSRDLGQPSTSTWNRLKRLKKLGRVSMKHCPNFTIVSICNWVEYQGGDGEPPAKKPVNPDAYDGFDAFWSEWPEGKRKYGKAKCREKWKAKGLAKMRDAVMDGLRAWKASSEWGKDGGRFIPAPEVWLNQERWEAPVESSGGQIVLGVSTC